MRRKLFNIAAALSLVLCVTAGALWVRSYWVWDTVAHTTNWHPDPSGNGQVFYSSFLMHANGKITFQSFQDRTADAPQYQKRPGWSYARSTMTVPTPPTTGIWNRLGFALVREDVVFTPPTGREWHKVNWTIPYWVPTLLIFLGASALACPVVARHRAARRRAAGQCGRCGYDLRGTPERCPECGAVPAAAAVPNPAA